jgi:uncharacterized protein (DUF58 family)
MSTRIVLERLPANPSGEIEYPLKHLKRHRVYILPTAQGLIYGMMLIVMLLGAINYNNSMAYMLCFLLTSLGLVCMLHTYCNLRGLIVSSSKPKAIYAGQQALFPIQIDNRLGTEKFSIKIEQYESIIKIFHKRSDIIKESISIEAGKQTTSYYPVESRRRGLLKIERLRISSTFPLGIFIAWAYFNPENDCLVYPAPQGQKQLPLKTLSEEDADYGSEAGTDDFAGFRKYRPGDPVNSIAWKAFAREQGLLVKQFSGKGSQTLILSWDSVSHINSIESRLCQLCYWIIIAEQTSIHYGLEIPNNSIEPGHGAHHKERCLEALACYGISND